MSTNSSGSKDEPTNEVPVDEGLLEPSVVEIIAPRSPLPLSSTLSTCEPSQRNCHVQFESEALRPSDEPENEGVANGSPRQCYGGVKRKFCEICDNEDPFSGKSMPERRMKEKLLEEGKYSHSEPSKMLPRSSPDSNNKEHLVEPFQQPLDAAPHSPTTSPMSNHSCDSLTSPIETTKNSPGDSSNQENTDSTNTSLTSLDLDSIESEINALVQNLIPIRRALSLAEEFDRLSTNYRILNSRIRTLHGLYNYYLNHMNELIRLLQNTTDGADVESASPATESTDVDAEDVDALDLSLNPEYMSTNTYHLNLESVDVEYVDTDSVDFHDSNYIVIVPVQYGTYEEIFEIVITSGYFIF